MVVPSATGRDLLTEHAWYEYGKPEYQSVMDFDYIYGKQYAINDVSCSHYFSGIPFLMLPVIFILAYLYIFERKSSSKVGSSFNDLLPTHDDKNSLNFAPELSHSNTSTPAASPSQAVSNGQFRSFALHEDYNSKYNNEFVV